MERIKKRETVTQSVPLKLSKENQRMKVGSRSFTPGTAFVFGIETRGKLLLDNQAIEVDPRRAYRVTQSSPRYSAVRRLGVETC